MKLSLKIRSRSEIDDIKWDQLIGTSLQKVIYGFTWYLDTVCVEWVAVVQIGENGYEAIMPIPLVRKWGKQVVQQPLFCQFLGIFSKNEISKESYLEFINIISQKYTYISTYSFNPHNYNDLVGLKSYLPHLLFSVSNTYLLQLNNPYSHLYLNYSKDRVTNLRRSFKHNWQITESLDLSIIIELFKVNHQDRIEGGVSPDAYELLFRLCEVVKAHAGLKMYLAEIDNMQHAGIVLFVLDGKVTYIFNAANNLGRKGNARTYILDLFFKSHSVTHSDFDFESPEIESINRFYKSFGSQETPFLKIYQNNLPFPLRHIQNWRRQRFTSK